MFDSMHLLRRTSMWMVMTVLACTWVSDVRADQQRFLPPTPSEFYRLEGPQFVVKMPMEVIDGNPQSVRLRFTNPPLETGIVEQDGQYYSTVRMNGEGAIANPGEPELPRVTRLVMIGNTGNVNLNVTGLTYTSTADDFPILPAQSLDDDARAGFVPPDAATYGRNDWYPSSVAEISEPAALRDVRFVVVTVYPVQVNPFTGQRRVYDDVEISITNSGGAGVNEIHVHPTSISPDFKKLYTQFENFRGSSLDQLPVAPGKYIAICDSSSQIVTQVQRLIDWKRKRGIDAQLARMQVEIGSTTSTGIKAYINNQYTASNGQLEYVALIGDATTSNGEYLAIPTNGTTLDNYYGMLASGGPNPDPVPDLAVGRLTCNYIEELVFIVNKTIDYESIPYTGNTGWFTRGYCIANTGSAPSNTSTKQYTKQIMLQRGLSPVYFNSYSGYTNIDTLNAHLTEGVSVVNHRMSWISGEMEETDLDGCPVTQMLPFVMTITCGTGSFLSTTTLSEKWLRPSTAPNVSEYRGAIGAVGLSGAGTHTRYNNMIDAGVMYGLYALDIQTQGAALIAGKLELYRNYGTSNPTQTADFCSWANLMGDPAVPIWREFPATATVTKPSSLPVGTNNVTIQVSQGGSPVNEALVSLVKGTETFVSGYTNAAGSVNLPVTLTTTGSLNVTITKQNLYPYQGTISVVNATASLSYYSVTVDDDNTGGTSGDGNGVLNSGETADLVLRLQNTGTSQTVSSINGTLTCASPGITITSASSAYPNIAVGANAVPTTPFRVQVGAVMDSIPLEFHLATTSSAGNQDIRADVLPRAANVAYVSRTVSDANNRVDPGETVDVAVTFRNSGLRALISASGILRSLDAHVIVNDSLGTYGAVSSGSTASNSGNRFNVSADPWTAAGYSARLLLIITDTNGFRDSVEFVDVIGEAAATSPTGPDSYGYYAYDESEVQPAGSASVYEWIEIWNQGGTSLNFNDNSDNLDASSTVMLPFGFKFYGQVFDRVTICSNGWLAFGDYPMNDFRNYLIGSPLGPPNQVAAYWDDLAASGPDSNVYYRYDLGNHTFTVEWRTKTLWTNVPQFFQIILYDTTYYPTPTGDGKIKVQYQLCSADANQDDYPQDDNPYASVGIQNDDHSIGLSYCFMNTYASGAAPLGNERAIMFTTDVTGYIPTSLTLLSPAGGETWYQHGTATITWVGGQTGDNMLIELSRNGTSGPWETIVASTPNDRSHSFTVSGPPASACRVRITSVSDPGETDMSELDFTISALRIATPNGGEIWMADSSATITWMGGDPSANVRIDLFRSGMTGPWQTLAASTPNIGSYTFSAAPPTSSQCRVQVTSLSDATDTDASDADFSILVMQDLFFEDCESGFDSWTHSSAGGTWVDEWHVSTERAYAGTNSFKCGSSSTGNYAIYNDARLMMPIYNNLPANTRLYFQHQIQSETSRQYADSAYDGGIVEISVNGGAFTQITPVGGYDMHFRYLSGSGNPATGPMMGIPCYADSTPPDWRQGEIDLSAYAGQNVQIRFRFGSDRGTGWEGWYLDNIRMAAPIISPWTPFQPINVVLTVSGANLTLRWIDDGNLFYRIYSSTSPSGPWETQTNWWTTGNEFTITNGISAVKRFYQVVGWDGN